MSLTQEVVDDEGKDWTGVGVERSTGAVDLSEPAYDWEEDGSLGTWDGKQGSGKVRRERESAMLSGRDVGSSTLIGKRAKNVTA